MRKHLRIPSPIAALAGASLLFTSVAQAQIEEIVVTATKRGSVNVQDVAYNITAVDGSFLDRAGAEDFYDFARRTGIQVDDAGPGEKQFIIRGLNLAGSATVGLYYDNIPTTGFGQTANGGGQPDFRVLDLERVEVLRGPQGTLYGAGSVGGTIRYVSRKPNLEEFSGNVGLDIGTVDEGGGTNTAIDATINIPLIENQLGLRVVGFVTDKDGINNNPFLGIEGTNFHESDGGRAILHWQPTDALTVTGSYWKQNSEVGDRQEFNPTCNPAIHACYIPGFPGQAPVTAAPVFSTDGNRLSTQGSTTPLVEDMDIFALDLSYETSLGTFSSSSSWFNRNVDTSFESSDLAANFFGSPDGVMPVLTGQDSEQFSQEFLFSSNFEGPVNFVAGVFYQKRDDLFRQKAVISLPVAGQNGLQLLANPVATPLFLAQFAGSPVQDGVIFNTQIDRDLEHTAVFGEVNWQVTDRLAVDLGLRWFELDNSLVETKILAFDFPCIAFGACDSGALAEGTYSDTILKLTVSYDITEDILAYATYSEGFREGGVNPIRTSGDVPVQYDSDEAKNFDLGLKTELLDGQLVLNTSYYYTEVRGLQIGVGDRTQLFGLLLNMDDDEGVNVQGLEVEAIYAPTESLQLQFGAQWTDTEITATQPIVNDAGFVVVNENPLAGRPGDPLPGVAEWTLSGNVQYNFPAFGRDAFVLLDWSYTGDSNTSNNPTDPTNVETGDFHLFGLRAGLSGEDWGGWSATVYASNLFGEEGLISYGDRSNFGSPFNADTVMLTYPRTIGFNFRKNF